MDKLNAIAVFLQPAAEVEKLMSSTTNFTVSMQPRIFRRLSKQCDETLSNEEELEVAKNAARLLKPKLQKYEMQFTSPMIQMCAALDPRFANKPSECSIVRGWIRKKLEDEYGVLNNCASVQPKEKDNGYGFLESDESGDETNSANDEIEQYFSATRCPHKTCRNVVDWWMREGQHRYLP